MGSTDISSSRSKSVGVLIWVVTILAVLVAAWGFWFDTHANANGVRAVPYLLLIFAGSLGNKAIRSFHMALLASALYLISLIVQPPRLGADEMLTFSLMSATIIWVPSLMSIIQRRRFARLDEKLYEVAKLDRLTRLHNRHFLLEELDKAIQRWRRGQMRFSVMLVDIDGLSRINGHYGEQVGDEVLGFTGRVLRACCRDLDYLGRLGADRFLLILPATEAKDAMTLALRIQEKLTKAPIKSKNDEAVAISVSIGIVQFNNGRWSAEDTLAACDAALDTSRAEGYGEVSVYDSDEAPEDAAERADSLAA